MNVADARKVAELLSIQCGSFPRSVKLADAAADRWPQFRWVALTVEGVPVIQVLRQREAAK